MDQQEKVKKQLATAGISMKNQEIKMVCIKCNRHYDIRSKNKEFYTPEKIANYVCILCRGKADSSIVKVEQKIPIKRVKTNISKTTLILDELLIGGKTHLEIAQRVVAKLLPQVEDPKYLVNQVKGVLRNISKKTSPRYTLFDDASTATFIKIEYNTII